MKRCLKGCTAGWGSHKTLHQKNVKWQRDGYREKTCHPYWFLSWNIIFKNAPETKFCFFLSKLKIRNQSFDGTARRSNGKNCSMVTQSCLCISVNWTLLVCLKANLLSFKRLHNTFQKKAQRPTSTQKNLSETNILIICLPHNLSIYR